MDKSTDSTTSSAINSNGISEISSTASDSSNITGKNASSQATTTKASTTWTKNRHNSSLGCGLSPTTTESSPIPSHGGNSSNINSNNIMSPPNNISPVRQTSNCTTANTNFSTNISTPSSDLVASATHTSTPLKVTTISLNISTTTGGNFSVSADPQITVENLKKIIAKRLKVAKDRICLLHREKELQDGLLKENNLMDGSKIILIPNVETGLLAQRPENTVMHALESLNDTQVNDFLSGKTPLNLSMRLGDHMMLIQLQLSTVNPANGVVHNGANCNSSSSRQRSSHHHHHRSSRTATSSLTSKQTDTGTATIANHSHHHHHHHHHHHNPITESTKKSASLAPTAVSAQIVPAGGELELDVACQTSGKNINTPKITAPHACRTDKYASTSTSSLINTTTKNSDISSFLGKRDIERLQHIQSASITQPSGLVQQTNTTSSTTISEVQSFSTILPNASTTSAPIVAASSVHSVSESILVDQSPIKSLSNLVSSPIKTTPIQNIPKISNITSSSSNSVALGPHTTSISALSVSSSNASVAAVNTAMCQDPIAAKLTSCLCTRLNESTMGAVNGTPHASARQCIETACTPQQQLQTMPLQHHSCHEEQTLQNSTPNSKANSTTNSIIKSLNYTTNSSSFSSSRYSSSLHKTAQNALSRTHRHHYHHHHHHHHYHLSREVKRQLSTNTNQTISDNNSTSIKISANDSGFNSGDESLISTTTVKSAKTSVGKITQSPVSQLNTPPIVVAAAAAPSTTSNSLMTAFNTNSTCSTNTTTTIELDDSDIASDSRTLAEASRNLTQTLRKLSKEVFTNKINFSTNEEKPRKSGSGAVIESMKNHGKGIYSGTFSGTLNPALQDRYGRPKRDISTVIHILNDLLSATPQYHRGARISFEAPSTSAAAASIAAASGSVGTVQHSSRSKHLSSKHLQSSHTCIKCIKAHSSSTSTRNLQSVSTSTASGTTKGNSLSTSSSLCAYGECNGHYADSKAQLNKIYSCCQRDFTTRSASATTALAPQQHQTRANSSSSTVISSSSNDQHHNRGSSQHHHHHHHQMIDERKVCQCRYRAHSETGEREHEYVCKKCVAELDNIKTKSKLDQLRLVLQQRKQKREARKLKGAPYGARVVGTTTTATASALTSNSKITTPINVATSPTAPSEVSPNHLAEEVDTVA